MMRMRARFGSEMVNDSRLGPVRHGRGKCPVDWRRLPRKAGLCKVIRGGLVIHRSMCVCKVWAIRINYVDIYREVTFVPKKSWQLPHSLAAFFGWVS